jgi:hypothetical protein
MMKSLRMVLDSATVTTQEVCKRRAVLSALSTH